MQSEYTLKSVYLNPFFGKVCNEMQTLKILINKK